MRSVLIRRSRVAAGIAVAFVLALGDGIREERGVQAAQSASLPERAEAGVREALQKYSAALESLDANAVKKIQPSVPVENLARAFKEMRELKVEIDAVRVLSLEGETARVSCRVTQTLTPRAGSKQTTAVTRVMRLRRETSSWVIDAFER